MLRQELKFQRKTKGHYVAPLRGGGSYVIKRDGRCWAAYKSGYTFAFAVASTLREATLAAEAEHLASCVRALLFQKVKAGFYAATLADNSRYLIEHVLNPDGKKVWSLFTPLSTKGVDHPTFTAAKVAANEHYICWAGPRRKIR